MSDRKKLVAANWKMNGTREVNQTWLSAFHAARSAWACDVVVCPPFVYLDQVRQELASTPIALGAQDLAEQEPGACTGAVAAEMLLDLGCRWVIVGHSERRAFFGEDDAVVARKVRRAMVAGLLPMVCVGETLAQREAGETLDVVSRQLRAVLDEVSCAELALGAIAYEPVWAIGTGRTATPEQAQAVHAAIRLILRERDAAAAARLRILYGGSVKPGNAQALFSQADIDGGLIGGASLNAADFLAICTAAG
ncbi:MAG TPA: triose-phosphate isomerase [Burkholderiaceae bacterium]|nr:triose-phosphate isomerase [Burkholderiaceae bacterium]